MTRFTVVTTINHPTWQLKATAERGESELIVIGDAKTPVDFKLEGARYMSLLEQQEYCEPLSKEIPVNHYARKMMGYKFALDLGATEILDLDDDNVIRGGEDFPRLGQTAGIREIEAAGWANVHEEFSAEGIGADTYDPSWPRGFPLREILHPSEKHTEVKDVQIGIWQSLVDVDPDVDAIHRLTRSRSPIFLKGHQIALGKNTWSPFNSQATLTHEALFPTLYLPVTVSFRYTDILRSIVAQPAIWMLGKRLGFISPVAQQDRNIHDIFDDFTDEISMYTSVEKAAKLCLSASRGMTDVSEYMFAAYSLLSDDGIVNPSEKISLNAWLEAISSVD